MRVAAVHPSPFRFTPTSTARNSAGSVLPDLVNELYVLPAAGTHDDDVERELFDLPGVASVLPAATSSQVVQDSLDEFAAVFRVPRCSSCSSPC